MKYALGVGPHTQWVIGIRAGRWCSAGPQGWPEPWALGAAACALPSSVVGLPTARRSGAYNAFNNVTVPITTTKPSTIFRNVRWGMRDNACLPNQLPAKLATAMAGK